MSGYRRAALALHALGADDRNWILDALPGADKAALQACLRELKELGFAPDAISLAEAVQDAPAAPPRTPAARVRSADAGVMFSLLKHEPNDLIGQLLALDAWPWAESFLGMFPEPRAIKIRAVQQSGASLGGARSAWLLDALAAPLGRAAPALAAPRAGSIGGLLARLGRAAPVDGSD